MAQPAADHRRATAERNVEAILDGAERLLQRGAPLTIAAVATEAGVSRVTVYAHFARLPQLVEAVVARVVGGVDDVLQTAAPDDGPALDAVDRVVDTGWAHLDRHAAVAAAAAEHLSPAQLHSSHAAVMGTVERLLERGRTEGTVRDDLPLDWLVTALFALMHNAGDQVRADRLDAAEAPAVLRATVRSLLAA
ncbi:MAG TPA: helix-turn-helix domain-containing protein [Conexibacter sp.]|jgi:AcrR family transcriptional regulator